MHRFVFGRVNGVPVEAVSFEGSLVVDLMSVFDALDVVPEDELRLMGEDKDVPPPLVLEDFSAPGDRLVGLYLEDFASWIVNRNYRGEGFHCFTEIFLTE